MARAQLRVVIADDEPIMRDVARLACEEHGVEIVGEVSTGEDAVEAALRLAPDVLIVDLDLHDIDGFEVSRRLRAAGCTARVLATTGEGGPAAVFRAIRTGIGGLLDKFGVGSGLAGAIAALSTEGGAFTDEQHEVARAEFGTFLRRARERDRLTRALTRRERDVVRLIAAGLTTRQMATRLGLAEATVESHITRAYRKLGVRSRVQAVARAVQCGIADLGPRSSPAAAAAVADGA
ncbi:MAG: LuxR C-terminal-related transcriptional regulator [Actinomycetota bacterium]